MVGFMLKYASTVRVKLTVALQSIPFTLESENSAILVPGMLITVCLITVPGRT